MRGLDNDCLLATFVTLFISSPSLQLSLLLQLFGLNVIQLVRSVCVL